MIGKPGGKEKLERAKFIFSQSGWMMRIKLNKNEHRNKIISDYQ